nr:MAG TPA: hypothetical protein [Caudoviricetes sp.]
MSKIRITHFLFLEIRFPAFIISFRIVRVNLAIVLI